MNRQQWVLKNCKFASDDLEEIIPAAPIPSASSPAVKAPLSMGTPRDRAQHVEEMESKIESRPKPQLGPTTSEDDLINSAPTISVKYVFEEMAEQTKSAIEAVSHVNQPDFPSFTEAYSQAFGAADTAQTLETLSKLDQFFNLLAQNQKFASLKRAKS